MSPPARVRATPAARRLARALGIDLAALGGRQGRLTAKQLLATTTAVDQGSKTGGAPGWPTAPRVEGEKVVAPHVVAKATASVPGVGPLARVMPPAAAVAFSLWTLARAPQPVAASAGPNASGPSRTSIVVAAVARALRDHPGLNAILEGDQRVAHSAICLGLVLVRARTSTTALIEDADRLGIVELDRRLAAALSPPRHSGWPTNRATFTIVDLSETEVDGFTPQVRPPQVATLGIGRCTPRVVAVGDGLRVEPTVTLHLTCNAGAVDEAEAAAFLSTLRTLVDSRRWVDDLVATERALGRAAIPPGG